QPGDDRRRDRRRARGAVGALAAVTDPLRAAAIGAYVNGLAGDAAAKDMGDGLVATDLPDRLPEAMRDE
ncbi:hypothetical protein FK85_31050, partial [Halorubrum saccharovorum]